MDDNPPGSAHDGVPARRDAVQPLWVRRSHQGLRAEIPATDVPATAALPVVALGVLAGVGATVCVGLGPVTAALIAVPLLVGTLLFASVQVQRLWWMVQRFELGLDQDQLWLRRTVGPWTIQSVRLALTDILEVCYEPGEIASTRLSITVDRPPFKLLIPAGGAALDDLQWWVDRVEEARARADPEARVPAPPEALRRVIEAPRDRA